MLDIFQSNFDKLVKEKNFSPEELKIKKLNFDNFLKNGFPNKKLEDWKFLDLNQILNSEFENFYFDQSKFDTQIEFFKIIKNFDHNQIFLLNGELFKNNFEFDDLDKIKIFNKEYCNEKINKNSLVNLNHAFTKKSIKIEVLKGYRANKPIVIYNYISDQAKSSVINSNIHIELGEDSALELINLSNSPKCSNFLNNYCSINIKDNATLKAFNINEGKTNTIEYNYNEIDLSKNSHLEYFIYSTGSTFAKHEINCSLYQPYGSAVINGVLNLEKDNQHEIKTVINHNDENCRSYQLIKNALNDNSKGVYQGKIFVDQKAQKTDGYQLSRALLLSEETEFNAKPELEIYADDVKCSHGSTSGNIDENAIFYLMSRGLSYNQSRQLLINGFLQEVIEKISTPEIKKLIKKITGIRDEN
jgi:Fe-S cluster assembly protein SufD